MPVVISGVDKTLAKLNRFHPFAARTLESKIKEAVTPLVARARGYAPSSAPLSGWGISRGIWANRTYNAAEVRGGIGFSNIPTKPNRRGFSYTAYIYNKSAAGAIYETAGRKNPNGRPPAPSVQHYANAGTPLAKPDYKVRNSSKRYSQSANPYAGKQFIESLGTIYKVPRVKGQKGRSNRKKNGRLIFRAWAEDQGKVLAAVNSAYSEVINKFNRGQI